MTSPLRSPVTLTAVALGAMTATFAAGAAWTGSEQEVRRVVAAPPGPVAPSGPGTLEPVDSCRQLLDHYVEHSLDRVTAWGWDGWWGPYVLADGFAGRDGVTELAVPLPTASVDRAAASSATGTNVQEDGVDEADLVKTDGSVLVRVDGHELSSYDVSGDRVRELARIELPGPRWRDHELLLAGDRLLVVARDAGLHHVREAAGGGNAPITVVHHVDLADPAAPVVTGTDELDGELLSARLHGGTVRLVTSTGLPQLDFVHPTRDRGRREALQHNRQLVRDSTIEDWLPSVRQDGADAGLLVDCTDVHLPEEFSGAGSVVVTSFDAATPRSRSTTGVATTSTTVYSSVDRLYLATSPGWFGVWPVDLCCGRPAVFGGPGEPSGVTQLHAFALDGAGSSYLGSGEVEGNVADRWAMDSVDGVLRVAVGPTSETGNFNSVVTFAERDGRLVEMGRVDRLGVDEQIQSVRWFDDLAVVVTFRQVDPLYAIDLSDPARPRRLGELKVPGFSSYLHPIGDDLLLGLGTDATLRGRSLGGQAATFDLSDLSAPRRVDTVGFGARREVRAAEDPRQFTWLPGRRTALTVVLEWGRNGGATGWVSMLTVDPRGRLTDELVVATHGWDDVATLRTVPLPDGRVVLSAQEGTRFLSLPVR